MMSTFEIIAVLVTLAALFSYVNHRFIRLPTTIGVMLISLVASLLLIALSEWGHVGERIKGNAEAVLAGGSTSGGCCSRGCRRTCCSRGRRTSRRRAGVAYG